MKFSCHISKFTQLLDELSVSSSEARAATTEIFWTDKANDFSTYKIIAKIFKKNHTWWNNQPRGIVELVSTRWVSLRQKNNILFQASWNQPFFCGESSCI